MGHQSLGVCGLVLALPLSAMAATMTVNSTADNLTAGDGQCTLREAIANVNAAAETTGGDCVASSGGGDTIVFNLPLPATIGLRLGHLPIRKDVTVTGPTQGRLSIDGRRADQGMELLAGTLNMSNLTIRHVRVPYGVSYRHVAGCTDAGFFSGCHSALYAAPGTTLVLTNCTFTWNSFFDTSALTIASAKAVLDHCTFARNSNDFYAGAVGVTGTGTATLTDCMFKGNSGGWYGAMAVEEQGTATLTDCTFIANHSWNQGGAFYEGGGGAVFTNCTFRGNKAYGYGGAISAGNATVINSLITGNTAAITGGGIDGSATVINSTLSRNTAGWGLGLQHYEIPRGGGAVATDGAISLTNCTLYNNRARGSGSAVFNFIGTTTLTNCTLSGNRVFNFFDYPAHAIDTGYNATTVTNTIIDGVPLQPNCGGVTSGGHNLSSDNTCFAPGGSDLLNTPPNLAQAANYGGMTPTLALCTGPRTPDASCVAASPAIDAGDDAVTGPPDNLTTDQRGLPRLSGAHVDIGAYEAQ